MQLNSLFKIIEYTPPTQEEIEAQALRALETPSTTSYLEFRLMFFCPAEEVKKILTGLLIRRQVDFKNDLWYKNGN